MSKIKRLQEIIAKQDCRITELEEHLCPHASHEWEHVSSYTATLDEIDFYTVDQYRCCKCGKMKEQCK